MNKLLLLVAVVAGACANTSPADPTVEGGGDGKADGYPSPNSLRSGTQTWSCHERAEMPSPDFNVELVHQGTKILSETIGIYHVIEGGAPVEDVGQEVFDVFPSAVSFLDSQELKFRLALQDYSDVMSWTVILQADPDDTADSYYGVLMSTYESSDGDGMLHPNSVLLQCTHSKS